MASARRRFGATLALALGLAAVVPARAAGWGALLRGSPAEDFDDEDLRLLVQAVRQALDAPDPSRPVQWDNPVSGAGGTLHVIGRPARAGFDDCRRVRAVLHSRRRRGTPAVWTACREAGGRWRLVGAG